MTMTNPEEKDPTWRMLNEQLQDAKAEVARLKALRNEGELNEQMKDPAYATKVALAGLIMERDELRAALAKQKKHNGALEIAIQEAHRDLDAAKREAKSSGSDIRK